MKRRSLLWPTIILMSALAASLVNFVIPDAIGKPIIVMWFLFVCPGMALVGLLRLKEPIAEWTLAIALSLSIDAVVVGLQVYTGLWSPEGALVIIIGFCLVGVIMQIALLKIQQAKVL